MEASALVGLPAASPERTRDLQGV